MAPTKGAAPTVTVLCGGVGAARFLRGLLGVVPAESVTAIVNVGDDDVILGLDVSPDLDTVTYTCAGAIDPERGWGLGGETWEAISGVRRYAERNGNDLGWFSLGDRDLATHLYRTARRREGATLSEVSAEIAAAWDLGFTLLPATDDALATRLLTTGGSTLSFQEYFVREQHGVPIAEVTVVGAPDAAPAPGVLDAITSADVVVVAPSNPLLSIDPVLAVPGIREAVASRRSTVVAVSPLVGGAALKGPADRLMVELGHTADNAGIARLYSALASVLVIDHVDASDADAVAAAGMTALVAHTVMSDPERAAALAAATIGSVA